MVVPMNASSRFLDRFFGEEIDHQKETTDYFVSLYGERPAKDDIMANAEETDAIIFDGNRWKKFRLQDLIRLTEG